MRLLKYWLLINQEYCILSLQGFIFSMKKNKVKDRPIMEKLQETEALLKISQMLAQSMDLPTILQQIVDATMMLIPHTDQSVIHLADEANHLLRPLAVARPTSQSPHDPMFFRQGEGIAGKVIQTGNAINVSDTLIDERFIQQKNISIDYRSLLVAPIQLKEHTIGTLSVESKLPGTFTSHHERLLTEFGEQAALAIDRAQVLREEQEQRTLAEALREVSNIQGSSASLEYVLNHILKLLSQVVPYDTASVMLLENGNARLNFLVKSKDLEFRSNETQMNLTLEINKNNHLNTLLVTEKPFIVNDTRLIEDWVSEFPLARSWIGVPIRAQGQIFAFISLHKIEPNFFQASHADRLLAFASQASLTIQNAQLFDATQQRLKEVNLLFQVSQKLAESLEIDVILEQVIYLLKEQFNFYYVQVLLLDKNGVNLIFQQGSEPLGQVIKSAALAENIEFSIPKLVLKTGHTILSNKVAAETFYSYNKFLPKTYAELGVPLRSGETLMGVLDIHHQDPHQFREHDLQLIYAISEQLTLAVEKAVLYENLQTTLAKEQTARAQLVQTEKLAALGQIVASVAHELNNPLQAIQNALYLINLEENLTAQASDDLKVALNESNRMAGLIARLRETYRPTTSEEFQSCSINALVMEVEKLINTHLRRNDIEFVFSPSTNLPNILLIQDQIKQVILNIFLNAVESMPKGGKLFVQTVHDKENDQLILTIGDTGSGIHPDVLPYIFDPFVTTKDRGTGLGLAITHDIVRRHGGQIEPASELGKGTNFKIIFPLNYDHIKANRDLRFRVQ